VRGALRELCSLRRKFRQKRLGAAKQYGHNRRGVRRAPVMRAAEAKVAGQALEVLNRTTSAAGKREWITSRAGGYTLRVPTRAREGPVPQHREEGLTLKSSEQAKSPIGEWHQGSKRGIRISIGRTKDQHLKTFLEHFRRP